MHYKTIMLELLQENPGLRQQLSLSCLNQAATELKQSHERFTQQLQELNPTSETSRISSQAMELAVEEMKSRFGLSHDASDDLSLDGAMNYLRRHTPPA